MGVIMKRYLLLAVFCGLQVSCMIAIPEIKPTTDSKDAIVNVIKQYSDITKADVNQYKMLRFGGMTALGAFIAGATASVGAGAGAYEKAGTIKSIVQERAADWMTNPLVLAGLGSATAGFLSYKLFYPSVRSEVEYNMLDKINQFIDVCKMLENQTRATDDGSQIDDNSDVDSIVSKYFVSLPDLKQHLPAGWPAGGENADVMVYWALKNLADQSFNAQLLLNDIQSLNTKEKNDLRVRIKNYAVYLNHNLMLYAPLISEKDQREIDEIERGINLNMKQEQQKLMQAGRYALYGSMVKGAVSSVWNGIKELYAHPEILALLGMGWVTSKYLVPSIQGVSQSTWDTLRSLKK